MPDDFYPANSNPSGDSHGAGAIVAVPPRPVQVPAPILPYGAPAIPEILHAKPGLAELLHALRRRWLSAVGLGLIVGGVLAALVWFFVPVRYEIVALLRVSSGQARILEMTPTTNPADFATYKRTQAALLKSNFVLNRVLGKPEVKRLSVIQEQPGDEQLDWLSDQIAVDYPGDSEIMRITMRGDRPAQLVTIVNAVKQSYLDEIVNAERAERLRQRDVLDRAYKKNRDQIRSMMEALHQLQKQLNTRADQGAELDRSMAMRELEKTIESRNSLLTQASLLEMKISLMKAQGEQGQAKVPDYAIDHYIGNDPQVAQLKKGLADISEAITEEERRAKDPNARSLVQMRQKAQRLEEQLDERRNELRPALIEQAAMSAVDGTKNFLPMTEKEHELVVANLEKMDQRIIDQMDKLKKMVKYSSEIETRTTDLQELQDVTKQMGSQLKKWQIELESAPRITSIEDASAPSGNDAIRKYVGVGFAGIMGFGTVLFGVALLEFQSRRLNSMRELREGLGIPVIGHLPGLSARSWRHLSDASSPTGAHLQSLLTESVDRIRAMLIHSHSAHPPRVVMVASSDIQEGKTTVASQLAASLARGGKRTLLLDADVRNPSTHAVFGLPLAPGFCEVLRGEAEREAAVFPTPAQNLWLMPAGQFDALAVQSLSTGSLAKLMDAVREQYDFVIVDAPPVLKVADPLIFGQHIDAAVISVRRDVSEIPKIYDACERLKSVGVTVLGAVFNGVNERHPRRPAPVSV